MKKIRSLILTTASIAVLAASASGNPDPVNLGTAANFTILSKDGISTTAGSTVDGNVGVSPGVASAIVGFNLTLDASGQFATSDLVTGNVFASDYAGPTPAMLTTAVEDMEAAYSDAAGRESPDFEDLGAGDIGQMVLAPGLYRWNGSVTATDEYTLTGPEDGVWIFQIDGDFVLGSGASVNLDGGALPENVFVQVSGSSTLQPDSHFQGVLLSQSDIIVQAGATMTASLYSQGSVSLDAAELTAVDEEQGDPLVRPFGLMEAISSRGLILTGDGQTMNTSVIISGETSQTIVWRGRGPSINLDVPRVQNPFLEVFRIGDPEPLVTNTSYLDDENFSVIEGTDLVPGNIQETEAIATTLDLPAGAYSVRVSDADGEGGIAMTEAFAFFGPNGLGFSEPATQVTAISTRAPIGAGAGETLNTSFIILGGTPVTVVCRGRGPSIALDVDLLPNPRLRLFRIGTNGPELIAENDSYLDGENIELILGTPFIPQNITANEAIIVAVDLEPGVYSVVLSDVDGAEGVGIAEALLARDL